ncbi:hypothetical protein AGMMS49944_16990 [Spirochaetia bacterium]|nr:hypothetical protein AGMMS49944_16990 [Spirochaetia bacterium]
MLLTVQGYFEGDRFVTDEPVRIPERKKAIVTILDEDREESANGNKMSPAELVRRRKDLDELERLLDESMDEEVPEFPRAKLYREVEI